MIGNRLHRLLFLCMMVCLACFSYSAYADVYAEWEQAGPNSAYHTNTKLNSRRTDHFLMRFGYKSRDGLIDEQTVQGQLQFLEHVYDYWQGQGFHPLGGTDPNIKYKGIVQPHGTWDSDSMGTAVSFGENTTGGYWIPGIHVPANALNYTQGNGCTPHEFGHGWQNQHTDSEGMPAGSPTEAMANWMMLRYLAGYPGEWYSMGVTYGHATMNYNAMGIYEYFYYAPGYGVDFINKLVYDPKVPGANFVADDLIRKAIRCDTSGAVDKASAIHDGLGMMNAKLLDDDFPNKRLDHAFPYDSDSVYTFYRSHRVALVKQPGATGWYRPEWMCTPQMGSNSYTPLTITATGSSRVVSCDFRPVSDAVRASYFRACFVAFNKNKEPRYSKLWNAGENSITLADDENAVYLAVYAAPREWSSDPIDNEYTNDNVGMFPYRVKFTGAIPKAYQWTAPATGFHAHSNGGGIVANTAAVDSTAYVGPNAMVLGKAKVYGYSRIEDSAVVDGNAIIGKSGTADNPVISGHAYISDNAQVYGHARVRDYVWVHGNSQVYGNALLLGRTHTADSANISGNAVVTQCAMQEYGLPYNGAISGSAIIGGDTSGGINADKSVYLAWTHGNSVADNKYQYIGYNFEKKSAIFAMDQYGLNHGFLMGEPQVVSDSVNGVTTNALSLNGSSQYIELKPEAADFPDVTVAAWVKWEWPTDNQRIFSTGDGNTKYMYLTPRDASTNKVRFAISNGTTTQYIDGTQALATDTWSHVAVTLIGNTGTLYVNGLPVGQNTISIDPDQLHASLMEDANYVGRGNSGDWFAGRIDEFRIYSKGLSGSEVAAIRGDVTTGAVPTADTAAPTPNAATWLVAPNVSGDGAITMSATEGTDAGGNGVLYYFRCVNDATHDSGWISEPKFTDCKCAAGNTYTYTVKMKDKRGNTGAASAQAGATMPVADISAPTPNAPTFEYGPKGISTTSIAMTATKGTDADEMVLYRFSRAEDDSITSGWTTSRTWTDTGLISGSTHYYVLQMKDGHGNATATTTSAAAVARDDTPPAFDTERRMQWESEPYTRLDKSMRMVARRQLDWDVQYYFECVENPTVNSGWLNGIDKDHDTAWITPPMSDGTWSFRFKIRDYTKDTNGNIIGGNQTGWSVITQGKVLTTNCYHDYSVAQLAGLADSTLVRFTGRVTQVNLDNYVVSSHDGLTSIKVTPHNWDCRTNAMLLNQIVQVRGHIWTYNGGPKVVTYAYVLGYPASGKLEIEDGYPVIPGNGLPYNYHRSKASGMEFMSTWEADTGYEFPNVAAATQLTLRYGNGGCIGLYVNGAFVKRIDCPNPTGTGDDKDFADMVVTGLNIPDGATVALKTIKGTSDCNPDYIILGTTYAVSGKVTDATAGNAPVAGAVVYFSPVAGVSGANFAYSVVTDASGNYSVRLPAGTWYVATGLFAEIQTKASAEQSFTLGPDKSGVNLSVNWLPSRTGKIEAEAGGYFGGATPASAPTASGGEAVCYIDGEGRGVYWSNVGPANSLTIRYAVPGGGTNVFSLYINDTHVQDVTYTGTGNWDIYTGQIIVPVTIPEHATVKLQHDPGENAWNLDYVVIGNAASYNITASAGGGGTISPSGTVSVITSQNQTFTITPNTGYAISDVVVDGVSKGAIASYTFNNVVMDHTISATFTSTTQDLLAFYQFENNVLDTLGNYNGTAYSSPTYVAGKVGSKAIQFNGSSQYVTIPRPVSGSFTISFWVKTTQTSTTGTQWYSGLGMVDGEVGGPTNDYGITHLNNKVAFGIGNNDTTIQSSSTINSGNWMHVACTRDKTTGQMRIYINGILETTGTGPTGTKDSPTTLHIGNLQTGGNYFNGAIDQLRIYNYVLNAAGVLALAQEGTTCTIAASAVGGGSISPSGSVIVNYGSSQTFTATPAVGYAISGLKIDGVSITPVTNYTFGSVTTNHTIEATFAKPYGMSNKTILTDKWALGKTVRVWGKVGGYVSGGTTFTISDGYLAPITVNINGATLPPDFGNSQMAVVTGIVGTGKTVQAQDVRTP